jgi:hypothetical protein
MQNYVEQRIADANAVLIEAMGEVIGELMARIEKLEKKK